MKPVLQIPHDIGAYCRNAAKALEKHNERLQFLLALYGEGEEDDPENDYYWDVSIEHPEVRRLRDNLKRIADALGQGDDGA